MTNTVEDINNLINKYMATCYVDYTNSIDSLIPVWEKMKVSVSKIYVNDNGHAKVALQVGSSFTRTSRIYNGSKQIAAATATYELILAISEPRQLRSEKILKKIESNLPNDCELVSYEEFQLAVKDSKRVNNMVRVYFKQGEYVRTFSMPVKFPKDDSGQEKR